MVTAIAAGAAAGIASGLPNRRLKKLGFKQLLSIQRGSSGAGLALAGATEAAIENEDHQDKGLGVDASEISEHHLQAALSSSQLASETVSALSGVPGAANGSQPSTSKAAYHIPTPDAKAVLMQREYHELYPIGAYSDPVTYVRSSKTVEESLAGPLYILDEEDDEWLQERNKKAAEGIELALRNVRAPQVSQKGKGKERTRDEIAASLARENLDLKVISEDEFEMIMTMFEQVTSDKVPFAHLDISRLPLLEDLLPSFDNDSALSALAYPELPVLPWEHNSPLSSSNSKSLEWSPSNPYRNLPALKNMAKAVYPWWKRRREDRDGKAITPVLNFDESNENDPYVCFRRREVKMIRKTRKTDAMHLEKLVRLRYEMQQSVTLLSLLAQREKTKRASLFQDKACWTNTRDFLDVKRQWNIAGPNGGQEDDELVSGDKRDEQAHGVAAAATSKKRRKLDESAAAATATTKEAVAAVSSTSAKAASRKSRPSGGDEPSSTTQANASASNAATAGPIGLGSAILDRVQAVQAYIEREVQRKTDSDVGWEEGSDAAFQPMPIPAHLRSFRPIHMDPSSTPPGMAQFPWANASPTSRARMARAGRPASFRRRMGRGGRIFLDRRLPTPSPVPASLSDWPRPELSSRSISQAQRSQRQPASQDPTDRSKEAAANQTKATSASSATTESNVKGGDTSRQQQQQTTKHQQPEPLTGPFAFSASIRPSLLSSSPIIARAATSASSVAPSSSAKLSTDRAADGNASDAASSTSSQHSKESATTKATSLDEGEEAAEAKNEDEEEQNSDEEIEEEEERSEADSEEEVERWTRLQERWRYDDEAGRWAGLGLCGLGGMEDDDEAIIDDFDQRFMRFRMNLLEETDLIKLSTDLSNVMQAQAAADAPPSLPAGYAIYRGEATNLFQAQQQQQQQQQQVQQAQAQQHAQQQAAAQAAALGHNGAALARAAQSNVGGPLAALQQQQPLQQAQLQLALQQQQQQRAAHVQAQALAAAAAAVAASPNTQAQQQGSPVARARVGVQQQQAMQMPQNGDSQSGSGQQHPLAQSFNVQGLGVGAQPMGPNARFAPNGMPGFPASMAGMPVNGMANSPQMQAHLGRATSSSSPVPPHQQQAQQGASPLMGHNGSYHSSPAQGHAIPMGQQQQQQNANAAAAAAAAAVAAQQRLNGAPNINLLNGGQMPALNPMAAAAAIQQAQAALQSQQAGMHANVPAQAQTQTPFTAQQLAAMQAALAQNANLQLKLPQNRSRALQLAAQQAAKGMNGQGGQPTQLQQQQLLAAAAAAANSGMLQGGQQPQLSQAQIGMGLLQNLQQQINYAQQNSQQQNLTAALNAAAVSMGPNNNGILAALNQTNSPQTKGRS